MYHLPACCCASDVIVIIELEERAGHSVPDGEEAGKWEERGLWLHIQGCIIRAGKSSVRRFVIFTWDLLGEENSPSNALAGHVFASDQGRTLKLLSDLSAEIQSRC